MELTNGLPMLIRVWIFICLLGCVTASGQTTAIGIAADTANSDLSDLVAGVLAKDASVRIVARGDLTSVRFERKLESSGVGTGVGSDWIAADLLLRMQLGNRPDTLRVELVDTKTGIILNSLEQPAPQVSMGRMALARMLTKVIQKSLNKAGKPADQLRVVSLPPMQSINGLAGDQTWVRAFDLLVRERLAEQPEIVLAERLRLDEVVMERLGHDAASLPALQQATTLVQGKIDEFTAGREGPISVSIEWSGPYGTARHDWSQPRASSMAGLADEVVRAITEAVKAHAATAGSVVDEHAGLLERARWYKDMLLADQALDFIRLAHFLQPPTKESLLLQYDLGCMRVEHIHWNDELDANLAFLIEHLSLMDREFPTISQPRASHLPYAGLTATLAESGDGLLWMKTRKDLTEPQREAQARLTMLANRVAEKMAILPVPDSDKKNLLNAYYQFRLDDASNAEDFAERFRAAVHGGIVLRKPQLSNYPFEINWAAVMEQSLPDAITDSTAEALAYQSVAATADPAKQREIYEKLAQYYRQIRETAIADPRGAIREPMRKMNELRVKYPHLQTVPSGIPDLIVYALENGREPIRVYDAGYFEPWLTSPEDAAAIAKAAVISRDLWLKSDHRWAQEHVHTMEALLADAAKRHPDLAALLPGIPTEKTPTPLQPKWFWSVFKPAAEKGVCTHWLQGITFFDGAIWATNGCQIYRTSPEGKYEIIARRQDIPNQDGEMSFTALAVDKNWIVATQPEYDASGEHYQVLNRSTGKWRTFTSPFRNGDSAENAVFTVLTFHEGIIYRPVILRGTDSDEIHALEAFDPETGAISYPIRGDRSPAVSPMDQADSRYHIAGVDADGGLIILGRKAGKARPAMAHAWYPSQNRWRKLSTEEWRSYDSDRLEYARTGTKPGVRYQVTGFQSAESETAPPSLRLKFSNGQTRIIPVQLSVSESERAAWMAGQSKQKDCPTPVTIEDAQLGVSMKAQMSPLGLVVVSGGSTGFFLFDNASLDTLAQ